MKKSGVVFSLLAFLSLSLLLPAISLAGSSGPNSLSSQIMSGQTAAALSAMHMSISDNGGTPTFGWDKTPWRVDQGGTGATSFTNGSLMFYSNGFSQDNANIFWDFANHVLDIGTNASSSPIARLNVKGGSGQGLLNLISSTGVSQVFVAGNGNVGFGTTNPHHRLDVVGAIYSRLVTASNGSIDWNAGNIQSLTLSSLNTAITFANGQAGGEYKLILNQDATGGRTITWPATVKWAGGVAPTLTSGAGSTDVMSFLFDGMSYLGSFTLNFSSTPPIPPITKTATVSILAVAGGGGGGAGNGGGGGAGGLIYNSSYLLSSGSYPVTIGTGGLGGITGSNGSNTSFGTLIAVGGGGGGTANGADGGSGGGGGGGSSSYLGGSGISGQGNNGAIGSSASNNPAGGGGGAGSPGSVGTDNIGGAGGDGVSNSITGVPIVYAGGGGGGVTTGTGGAGGSGGGGSGAQAGDSATPGTPNTGGGGGGVRLGIGASGGSGVFILSYPTGLLTTTGGNATIVGSNTVVTFTSSGTLTVLVD